MPRALPGPTAKKSRPGRILRGRECDSTPARGRSGRGSDHRPTRRSPAGSGRATRARPDAMAIPARLRENSAMALTCQPRLLLIQAYSFPGAEAAPGGKEARLMNYPDVAPFLAGVAWDLHPGPASLDPLAGVETREEFMLIGARRLPIVREACESGRYDAIVLLGGGDPGFLEAREIGHRYGIPVTACAHAQMHVAAMLGEKFSFLDVGE